MANKLEVIRYSLANEYLIKSLALTSYQHQSTIKSIIDDHNFIINVYNKKKMVVVDPDKTEIGLINSNLKKIVLGSFSEDIKEVESKMNYNFSNKYKNHNQESKCKCKYCLDQRKKEASYKHLFYLKVREEINKRCDKLQLPKDIVDAKILLGRTGQEAWKQTQGIWFETNQYLKNEFVKCFNNKYKSFIKTHILKFKKTEFTPC